MSQIEDLIKMQINQILFQQYVTNSYDNRIADKKSADGFGFVAYFQKY